MYNQRFTLTRGAFPPKASHVTPLCNWLHTSHFQSRGKTRISIDIWLEDFPVLCERHLLTTTDEQNVFSSVYCAASQQHIKTSARVRTSVPQLIWSAGKCNAPNTPRHSKDLSDNAIVCGSTWADHDSSLTAQFRELKKKAWPLNAINISLISPRLRSLDLCPQQIAYSICWPQKGDYSATHQCSKHCQ